MEQLLEAYDLVSDPELRRADAKTLIRVKTRPARSALKKSMTRTLGKSKLGSSTVIRGAIAGRSKLPSWPSNITRGWHDDTLRSLREHKIRPCPLQNRQPTILQKDLPGHVP